MKLIIAEKPQLAQVIAEAIGIVGRKGGYYQLNRFKARNQRKLKKRITEIAKYRSEFQARS